MPELRQCRRNQSTQFVGRPVSGLPGQPYGQCCRDSAQTLRMLWYDPLDVDVDAIASVTDLCIGSIVPGVSRVTVLVGGLAFFDASKD